MPSITPILPDDLVKPSRITINNNFNLLNKAISALSAVVDSLSGGGGYGSQGAQGEAGIDGAQGGIGAQGAAGGGAQGSGAQGAQGNDGAQGNQGNDGTQGNDGAQGNQGNDGVQGATGTGAQGDIGAQGAQSASGYSGYSGVQGYSGISGFSGVNAVGITYYPGASASDIGPTYGYLSLIPIVGAETSFSVTLSAGSGTVTVGRLATNINEPAETVLGVGTWQFNAFYTLSGSDPATTNTHLTHAIYKRSSIGIETLLFSVAGDNLTNTDQYNPENQRTDYTILTPIALEVTDRLVYKIFANTTAARATISIYYLGNDHYSYLTTGIYRGALGVSGYSGISGYIGVSGYSGVSTSGYSGISGYSSYSGYSGYSGISGYSGYSGRSGYSGYSGVSGYSGISGYSGTLANTQPYTFSSTTNQTGIATGTLRFNNNVHTSTTQIYVDNVNSNGVDITAWFQNIDLSNNPVLGQLTVTSAANPNTFFNFNITNVTFQPGGEGGTSYYILAVNYVNSNNDIANNNSILIGFTQAGQSGYSGRSGYQGFQGLTGNQGTAGAQGATAASGYSGYSGATTGWTVVGKSSDQSVTNSSTVVADTDLQFNVTNGRGYAVRWVVFATTTSAAADYKFTIGGTASVSFTRWTAKYLPAGAGTTGLAVVLNTALNSEEPVNAAVSGNIYVEVDGVFVASSNGNIQYKFAQNTTTSGQSVTNYTGSYIEYKQLF